MGFAPLFFFFFQERSVNSGPTNSSIPIHISSSLPRRSSVFTSLAMWPAPSTGKSASYLSFTLIYLSTQFKLGRWCSQQWLARCPRYASWASRAQPEPQRGYHRQVQERVGRFGGVGPESTGEAYFPFSRGLQVGLSMNLKFQSIW